MRRWRRPCSRWGRDVATLLIRLVAPMQAWGTRSHFDDRDTETAPSRSGVLGLCAAALGIDRNDSIDDLCALSFGVRVDRAGTLGRDYHTAQLHPGNPRTKTDVTTRAYLADAAFWAGLEGDEPLLTRLHAALRCPHWPLSLGRRAFQPSLPLFAGPPHPASHWEALTTAPSLRRAPRDWDDSDEAPPPYVLITDAEVMPRTLVDQASPSRWQDVPAGPFALRQYVSRNVWTLPVDLPNLAPDVHVSRQSLHGQSLAEVG